MVSKGCFFEEESQPVSVCGQENQATRMKTGHFYTKTPEELIPKGSAVHFSKNSFSPATHCNIALW